MSRTLCLCLCILVALAGCAPRGSYVPLPEGQSPGVTRPVYVASVRAGEDRYARVDVSIPRVREPGVIRYPRGAPDPQQHFLVAGGAPYRAASDFRAAVTRALQAVPAAQREVVIYVHGFNIAPAEGTFRTAQLTHDLSVPGVAVHYSWPTTSNPLGYAHDRDAALWSRDGLRGLLRNMDGTGATRVILVAHSMGGQLVMETLRDIEMRSPGAAARLVDAVVLISPDIDVSLFLAQAAAIRRLPKPFAIVTSSRDRALRLSARLTGHGNRLGNLADPSVLSDLDVVLLDVSAFSSGVGHFTAGNSPALLRLLSGSRGLGEMLGDDVSGRTGLLPGTVLSVRNATHVILAPSAP